jgi:hypothetical protein
MNFVHLSIEELQFQLLIYLYANHRREILSENRMVGLCDKIRKAPPEVSPRKIAINRLHNFGYLSREFRISKFYFNLIPQKFEEINSLMEQLAKQ